MTIAELIEHLGLNKALANETYKSYKKLKEAEEGLKMELLTKLQEAGLKSARGDKYQATIAERPNIQITHEKSVIDWLNETPNVEADAYIGLKKTEFKGLALHVLKETGEIIPGTDIATQEVLQVRSNKK